MSYECELESGQHLEIDSEGDQTLVSFSHRGSSQQQSQGHGFTTGKWSGEPELFRRGRDFVLQINTADGARFLRIEGDRARWRMISLMCKTLNGFP